MSKPQRYEMVLVTRCGEGWQELQRDPDGSWMLHEDYEKIVARVAELERSREAWACDCVRDFGSLCNGTQALRLGRPPAPGGL